MEKRLVGKLEAVIEAVAENAAMKALVGAGLVGKQVKKGGKGYMGEQC